MTKKTTVFENSLIWFGAGVSIAEILTGTYLAPLGLTRGLLAVLTGHLIGCVLLFFAGYIGARTEKSAMGTAALSFGTAGAGLFATLNVCQLIGWTGIMIYDGSLSANQIFGIGAWIWALLIGALIMVWILIGISNLGRINTIAMAALFILTIIVCLQITRASSTPAPADGSMTFGAAVELSVAMPLSWFPLISDYTRTAEKPFQATLASALTYGLISSWMFGIGLAGAIYAGTGDIAAIMVRAGLGIAGLVIVVFSTVTTTFLDAYSAGVSSVSICGKISEKWFAILVCIIGTIGACTINMDNITGFLYLIGSVFAPMIAIMIADYFIIGNDSSSRRIDKGRIVCWVMGFAIYRILMTVETPVGNTLPDMLITMLIAVIYGKTIGKQIGKTSRD